MSVVGHFLRWSCGVLAALGCTNILVPAGSSVDGSTILAYNADSAEEVGALAHWPAGKHAPGELRPTYAWDTGTRLGAIPQPPETYAVIGNTNEYQLSMTETTFGGLALLDGTGGRAVCDEKYGCLDYYQLQMVALARSRTAREAMDVIDNLMQTYGYASTGESFSIADTREVWLMEIIGKGNFSKGAVWVATRIPDGTVCAHANQARTRAFLPNAPDDFRYSADVVNFARSIGLYGNDQPDRDFSFSDVYDPVTAYGARTCDARVYSLFSYMAAPEENIHRHLDYVEGRDLAFRMPLFVRVAKKISVNDTFWLMRDHFEGTHLFAGDDIGGGNWRSPIHLGNEGKVWTYKGKRYTNERPVGVSFTQFNLVATQRPNHQYGVLWFGVDDSTFTIRAPFYNVASRVPAAWDDGNCTGRDACRESLGLPGTIQKFSLSSMFWVTNLVANFAYSRWDVIAPAVYRRLALTEARLLAAVKTKDVELAAMVDDHARALAASDFSFQTAEALHTEWLDFYGELFATYVDGYTTVPVKADIPVVKRGSSLRKLIKANIAGQTGTRYWLPGKPAGSEKNLAAAPIDKRRLPGMGRLHDLDGDDTSGVEDDIEEWQMPVVAVVAVIAIILTFAAGVLVGRRTDKCCSARVVPSALSEPLTGQATTYLCV